MRLPLDGVIEGVLVIHRTPFHFSISGPESEDPTATHIEELTHETELRLPRPGTAKFWTVQVVPSHPIASGDSPAPRALRNHPTATQPVSLQHEVEISVPSWVFWLTVGSEVQVEGASGVARLTSTGDESDGDKAPPDSGAITADPTDRPRTATTHHNDRHFPETRLLPGSRDLRPLARLTCRVSRRSW